MSFVNLLRVAITAIMANKSRTLLSTLGIIIGVAAVIVMMAVGEGSKETTRAEMSKMGTNLLTIRPGADMRAHGARPDPSQQQTLKMEDFLTLQSECRLVKQVSPEVNSSGQAIYGSNNTTSTVYGGSEEYIDIRLWVIKSGANFTESDVKRSAKVCLVGTSVVKELFGDKNYDAVGKTIRFKSIPFRIVGILKSKGFNSWGMDQDNVIIAPYTTVMKRINAQTHFNSLLASAKSEEMCDDAIEEISSVLRRTHKIKPGEVDNFNVRSQQEWMETMSNTMNNITLILVVAAAFSLLVAGIGIMNIMLVSVTERTKEIGLRMSVGARGRDISRQFLLESIMISLSGGILGVLLGYGISSLAYNLGIPCQVPLWSVLLSFTVCALIGLLFGYIPARKAARMDPIEAIRYE